MREWGKRRRKRRNIIRKIKGGGKRPQVVQYMNHDDSTSPPRKVAEAQCKQWNKSSKPLLDGGQGKQDQLA